MPLSNKSNDLPTYGAITEAEAFQRASEIEYENWLENRDIASLTARLIQKDAMTNILRRENDGLQFRSADYDRRIKYALAKIDHQEKRLNSLKHDLAIAKGGLHHG